MRQLPIVVVLLAASVPAQNVFWGNGIPAAYVENTPGVLGRQLTVGFGSPTTPLPLAIFGLSDGLGPVFVPHPLLGTIGLDLFSPAYQALTFSLDPQGDGTATLLLPPGFPLASDPPLFAHAATFEATGLSISKTIRIEWANPDGWEQVPSLGSPRQLHTATNLGAGPRDNITEVLVCGGAQGGSIINPLPTASAELYSPLTRSLLPLGNMALPRASHRTVRLADGRALITGGVTTGGVVTATCEFFDIATLTFSPAPTMLAPRAGHAITLLDDGRVLVSGGVADWQSATTLFAAALNTAQDTAELYDPTTNTWSALPAMASKRFGHGQTKLLDGRVLVVSGINGGSIQSDPLTGAIGQIPTYTASCELFDPVSLTFSPAASIAAISFPLTVSGRGFHGQTLLPNGHVLVTGGFVAGSSPLGGNGAAIPTASCAFWDGVAWNAATSLPQAIAFHTQVENGTGAICAGGFIGDLTQLLTSGEVYQHDVTALTLLRGIGVDRAPATPQGRAAHTCTRLYDGTLLVYGGGVWPLTLSDGWVYTTN